MESTFFIVAGVFQTESMNISEGVRSMNIQSLWQEQCP